MEELYENGVMTIFGPESCAHVREEVCEALTGVRVGEVSSREKPVVWGADVFPVCGRQHLGVLYHHWDVWDLTRSKTLSTHVDSLRGNREILWLTGWGGYPVRVENPKGARRR